MTDTKLGTVFVYNEYYKEVYKFKVYEGYIYTVMQKLYEQLGNGFFHDNTTSYIVADKDITKEYVGKLIKNTINDKKSEFINMKKEADDSDVIRLRLVFNDYEYLNTYIMMKKNEVRNIMVNIMKSYKMPIEKIYELYKHLLDKKEFLLDIHDLLSEESLNSLSKLYDKHKLEMAEDILENFKTHLLSLVKARNKQSCI